MEYATLTNQNQITVPMRVRDNLKLKPSDKLVFYESGGTIRVSKLKSIDDFKGVLKDSKKEFQNQDTQGVRLERYKRDESKKEK